VDLSGEVKVLTSEWREVGSYLAWSPRGDEVWFTAIRTGWSSSLRAVSLDGRERLLLRLPGWINLQDVSSDGRMLLSFGKVRMEIRCRLDGWEQERDLSWFDHSALKDISADGETLLFEEKGESARVNTTYLRDTDGSPPQRLGEFQPIGFSPDASKVVAWDNTKLQYLVVPTGPGEPRYLAPKKGREYVNIASWLPDGRRLLAQLKENGRLRMYAVDSESGESEPLTPEGYECSLASPDGKRAICWTAESRRLRLFTFGQQELEEIPGIEDADRLVQWSADGGYIFLQSREYANSARIYRLELATGKREVWRELKPPDQAGFVRNLISAGLTPDGGSYCYSALHIPSDLYLVEGLR
jgi:dipeptidyl aminopeptidase/acylaminoacyl peptidase